MSRTQGSPRLESTFRTMPRHRTVLLCAAILLASCATPPAATPAPAPAAVGVHDSLGRTVTFASPPRRITVAGKSTLPLLEAMYLFPEARERVIGLVTGRQKPEVFLQFVDPALDGKSRLEVEAGPEQIAALTPDAVVLRSAMAEKLGQPLEGLGIPVVYLDMETPQQFERGVEMLGQLFGNEARADEIGAYYASRLELVASGLQGLASPDRPRILILQYTPRGGDVALEVPPASYLQTTMAELAGAVPVWKPDVSGGGWQVVNLEQILVWNPDQIYVISYDTDAAQVAAQLRADATWSGLQAVQDGHLFGFAGDIFSWDQPDPRWVLGQLWLARRVHPARFANIDMLDEVRAFFGEMYGMDRAAVDEHILPTLRGDVW